MTIDLAKYKKEFLKESNAHIKLMNTALSILKSQPENAKELQTLMRSAHTLKGLSGILNYRQCMEVCQTIENCLEATKNNILHLKQCMDLLFQCVDYLEQNLESIKTLQTEISSKDLIENIEQILISK